MPASTYQSRFRDGYLSQEEEAALSESDRARYEQIKQRWAQAQGKPVQGEFRPNAAPTTPGMSQDRQRALDAYAKFMAEREARGPVAPQITTPEMDAARMEELRSRQMGFLGHQEDVALGRTQSIGELEHARMVGDIESTQLGLAGQARGQQGVFAQREAMRNIQEGQRKAALDAALIGEKARAQARAEYSGALTDVRGADTGWTVEQARQKMATDKANQEAALRAIEEADRYKLGTGELAMKASDEAAGVSRARAAEKQAEADRAQKTEGAIIGGIATGGAYAFSDRRVKTDIHPESEKAQEEFIEALEPYSFRMQDDPDGEIQHGIMAQDLERSAIGRSVVHTGDDGIKRVDTEDLTLAMAGVVASLSKEVRRLRMGARR